MKRLLLHSPLLIIPLVAANVRLTPVPTQATGYYDPTITKSVVHTSILRRADTYSESSVSALPNTEHLLKRSDDLHSLHIPFQDEEGYMSLYLSNTTGIPFCDGVGTTIYEDSAKVFLALNVMTQNSTTVVPVREDKAIEFCQGIKKGKGGETESATSKASNRPSKTTEISGGSATPVKSDTEKTTRESSVKPTKAADKSTTPKSAIATPSQDDIEPSKSSSNVTSGPIVNKPAKSANSSPTTAKSTASSKKESDITTTEVLYITEPADSTKEPTRATTNASADEDEDTDTTTIEEVYVTPTADSTIEVMPETSFAETPEASAASAPKSDSDVESLEPTEDLATVKVAEIGHQKTATYASDTSYVPTKTSKPNGGAAVKARVWESKGTRRVEALGAGWWKKMTKRDRKERVDVEKEEEEEKETERVPAPQRPTSTSAPDSSSDESTSPHPTSTSTLTSLSTRKPATSANRADVTSTSTSPKTTNPKPTRTPVQDVDSMSFSFPTSSNLPNPNPPPKSHPKPHLPWLPPPPADSLPNNPPSHEQPSSAFGEIHDPRMVWTVRFMWVIAVLQVVCGVWEFVKNVRGRVHVDLIGRRGWWDRKIAEAG